MITIGAEDNNFLKPSSAINSLNSNLVSITETNWSFEFSTRYSWLEFVQDIKVKRQTVAFRKIAMSVKWSKRGHISAVGPIKGLDLHHQGAL